MEIPTLGIKNDLDPKIISKNSIVAVLSVCNCTLAVREHALDKYNERNDNTTCPTIFELTQLQYQLINSKVIRRKNEAKLFLKHGQEKAMYRIQKGWMFVLVWKEKLKLWLLKTAYPVEPHKMRGYKVVQTRTDPRASTWLPSFV